MGWQGVGMNLGHVSIKENKFLRWREWFLNILVPVSLRKGCHQRMPKCSPKIMEDGSGAD